MPRFAIYMVGVVLVVGAMGYGAYALGLAPMWIGIGVAVLFGFGLMGAAKKAGTEKSGGGNPGNSGAASNGSNKSNPH